MTKLSTFFGLLPFALSAPLLASEQDVRISLGDAGHYNAFVFDNFSSPSSKVEGRLAVGGNLKIRGYSIADELDDDDEIGADNYSLVVGGDANFSTGRVYSGHILIGGSGAGIGDSVRWGLSSSQVLWDEVDLPISFEKVRTQLTALSQSLRTLENSGTVEKRWGGLYLKGDCLSQLQIFNVSGDDILNAHTFQTSCIPEGSNVVFNISGAVAGFDNISLETLDDHNERVLFNFYEATSLVLKGVEVEGSILAPLADIGVPEPKGTINGTLIAKSWSGRMSFEWEQFEPYNANYIKCEGYAFLK
ncbi:choice-of-anchor A family protein [Photobacterium indicum]|uniref:choice-of-anchor A family protein n=1 Tax=Photobacterium indicum TaxID=81447 RepID=UPI003D0B8040